MHDSQFETPINTINISRFNFINPRLLRWILTVKLGYITALVIRSLISLLITTLSPVAILAPVFTMLGHIMDIHQITTGSIYFYGTIVAGFIMADQVLSLPPMRSLFVKLTVKAEETAAQLRETKVGRWLQNRLNLQGPGVASNSNAGSSASIINTLESRLYEASNTVLRYVSAVLRQNVG